MCEQILGYWVVMATAGGELQRWGHPDCEDAAIDSEDRALAIAARIASASTTDSVYVMTIYDNGGLSMRTICRPARDPSRPTGDAGTTRRW
jgi:hypothetical protein